MEPCYKAGANSFVFEPTEFMALKSTLTDICQYWTTLNQRAYFQRLPSQLILWHYTALERGLGVKPGSSSFVFNRLPTRLLDEQKSVYFIEFICAE